MVVGLVKLNLICLMKLLGENPPCVKNMPGEYSAFLSILRVFYLGIFAEWCAPTLLEHEFSIYLY